MLNRFLFAIESVDMASEFFSKISRNPALNVPLLFQCKPEYKVPGLYVIDSIVRQSRHQFNTEKDVFAPRFTKNIVSTFQNLFKCPQEEKVRTL